MKLKILALVLSSCALSAVASAEEMDQKTLYEIGKDVARLEREVTELKSVLQQILELDKQRVALLTQVVEGGVALSSTSPTKAPSAKKPDANAKGTIAGRVKLPKGGRVAYVYVENVRGRMVRGRVIDIVQRNKQFSPRWAVVQRGTAVRFPNDDSVYHNVFSRSANAKFDLGIYRKGDDAKSHTFNKPGVVDVFCNMHSKMSTQVLVVPNHLYTKAKADGRFTLANVPPGKRKVVAWVPGFEPVEAWINVPAGQTAGTNLAPTKARKKGHLNKSGQPYGSYR